MGEASRKKKLGLYPVLDVPWVPRAPRARVLRALRARLRHANRRARAGWRLSLLSDKTLNRLIGKMFAARKLEASR
jgi:hypothetical protein